MDVRLAFEDSLIVCKPTFDSRYHYIDISNPNKYGSAKWVNSPEDNWRLNNGLICINIDECIRKAEILLNQLKYLNIGGIFGEKTN